MDSIPLLTHTDPSSLSYEEWLNVGIALKNEGYTASDWDKWSQQDTTRYKAGECFTQWALFDYSNIKNDAGVTQIVAGYEERLKDGQRHLNPENLGGLINQLPDLAPPLIDGVLRQGHKMLIAGPSKAGKSFTLIGLSIAIAEGAKWLGWQCMQGKVLYINLDLDRVSVLHRFKNVYQALRIHPYNSDNIDIWNLRGQLISIDRLASEIIEASQQKGYVAIIIDPLHKLLSHNEYNANQRAYFTNQFDKIATDLGSSVIYCHHHNPIGHGNKKSMDFLLSSNLLACEPDALLHLVENELSEDVLKRQANNVTCQIYANVIKQMNDNYYADHVLQDHEQSLLQMEYHATQALTPDLIAQAEEEISQAVQTINMRSAWRVEGTLREYPKFEAVNVWFQYPVHRIDETGILEDIKLDAEQTWKTNFDKKRPNKLRLNERISALEAAFEACNDENEIVTITSLAKHTGFTEKTIRNYIKEHGKFVVDKGIVTWRE